MKSVNLVKRETTNYRKPIHVVCKHISPRGWAYVETELERHDYLLSDQIGDPIPCTTWDND
ncbi:DUF4327 family protein [cyanobacterium endosymbiont of Rhopalodia gibberula]|uniref:DUF4327 family protein n=1 Tax=cyanobacterium endosymbiont of Rhopalodia gibberula TaxID=1763363 RepID=UPI0026ADE8B4